MSDKAINPASYPRQAAYEFTIELIRAGKITYASDAANYYIEMRKLLEKDIEDIKNQGSKAQ